MCFYSPRQVIVYSPSTAQSLRFDPPPHTDLNPKQFNFGLVYIASTNSYKLVLLELLPVSSPDTIPPTINAIRFTAIAVPGEGAAADDDDYESWTSTVIAVPGEGADDDEPWTSTAIAVPGEGADDDDETRTSTSPPPPSSWELISEHSIPTLQGGDLGNLVANNGVVYATITFRPRHRRVLSLDFKQQQPRFKLFDFPKDACPTDSSLSEVKDFLCFAEATTSTISLWLLNDRNNSSWSKWAKISYASPKLPLVIRQVSYFPPTTTTTRRRRRRDGDGDGDDAGIFLFKTNAGYIQYVRSSMM